MNRPEIAKTIYLAITTLFLCFDAASQEDNLKVAQYDPFEIDVLHHYHNNVRQVLLKKPIYHSKAAFICIPPFSVEFALLLWQEEEAAGYSLIYRKASKSIWKTTSNAQNQKRPKRPKLEHIKVPIEEMVLQIDDSLAHKIIDIYQTALNHSYLPKAYHRGLDGVTYYFYEQRGYINFGKTWSPQKGTKMRELADISSELVGLVVDKSNYEKKRASILMRIENLAYRLKN